MSGVELSVFTIGHSNHPLDKFVKLLKDYDIDVIADTRSHPYSQYSPHFNRQTLGHHLAESGVEYEFWGDGLGGRPDQQEFYDDKGYVLYWRLAESPSFLSALERLKAILELHRVALLCSEENPSVCHRRLLIGRVLHSMGIKVNHIRGDGRLQTEDEVRNEEGGVGQEVLFSADEVTEWKSIQSGLQKPQQQISLKG